MKKRIIGKVFELLFLTLCCTTTAVLVNHFVFKPDITSSYARVFLGLQLLTVFAGIAKCATTNCNGVRVSTAFLTLLWIFAFSINNRSISEKLQGKTSYQESKVAPQ